MDKIRNEILSKIRTMKNDVKMDGVYKLWLKQVEDFICEKQNKSA